MKEIQFIGFGVSVNLLKSKKFIEAFYELFDFFLSKEAFIKKVCFAGVEEDFFISMREKRWKQDDNKREKSKKSTQEIWKHNFTLEEIWKI